MSSNRNINLDRVATAELLDADPETQQERSGERPNWLSHSKTNAAVDAALLLGATDAELQALRRSWRNHKHHLLNEHGLFVADHGGLYRFAAIDPFDPAEEALELTPQTDDHEYGDDLRQPSPRHTGDEVEAVKASQRFHGFVVLPEKTDAPAVSLVHSDIPSALALLNETAERTIFAITGSDEAAVAAAAIAVKLVWNHWVIGQAAAADANDRATSSSFMRDRGDWALRQPTPGAFYLYEYRTHAAIAFYVGKGKNGRYLQHLKEVSRKIADGLPYSRFSPKEQVIANEIAARSSDQLVRIVAEFQGPHAELCALVAERFLIGAVYGPFSLTNDNLGLAHHRTDQGFFHWLCQPQPVRLTPDYVPLWVGAANRLIETGRAWQTTEVNLSWMLVQPYQKSIRGQIEKFETTQLEFIGAGNNGSGVSFDWNVRDLPVRIQLVFSRHNTTVHFNLRPWAQSWRQLPTAAAHESYMTFINERFGTDVEGRTRVRMAGSRDCFFKPFAVGRVDASFDYADSTSAVLVKPLRAGGESRELTFREAMDHLLSELSA